MSDTGVPVAGGDGLPVADNGPPLTFDSRESWDDLFKTVQRWYRASRDHRHLWRQEAEADFGFVAGEQWDAEDKFKLDQAGRPALTWNRIGPFVDGISGLEIGNRQELRFIPRTLGAGGVNELLTAAAKWVRDNCDAEDEESGAFRDCVICGEGWTVTEMDYDQDPEGMIVISQVNPLEMFVDPSTEKANYADASYIMRIRDLPLDAARKLAPDANDWELDAAWADDTRLSADDPHNARLAPWYREDQSDRQWDHTRQIVRIVECEWYNTVRGWRVAFPGLQGKILTDAEHERLQDARKKLNAPPIQSVQTRHREYWRAIVGGRVLKVTPGPARGGFTYKCLTGKRDRMKRMWYGMVRPMRDPQMWSNKWLSQQLHIINVNAKGGVMVEEDVAPDMQEFVDSWAAADAVTTVRPGALREGAIQPKPTGVFHQGLQQMAEFAMNAIPQVTGFSPEMMGMTDRTQAGVVEMQRKQQGMAILADLFNALRRYRKEQGRLLLWFIQEFISDGRLIRIGGPDDAQYVSLVRDQTLGEYDIVVDDTPSSPNMKERTWSALVQLFPVLARLQLPPQVMLELFRYSPLPDTLIAKISTMMQQQMAQQQGNPEMQARVQEMQGKAQFHQAQAQREMAEARAMPMRVQLEANEQAAKIENLRAQALNDLQNAGLTADDQRFQQMMQAIDALTGYQQQRHDAAMDLIGAHQDAIDSAQTANAAQQRAAQMQQQQQQGTQQ